MTTYHDKGTCRICDNRRAQEPPGLPCVAARKLEIARPVVMVPESVPDLRGIGFTRMIGRQIEGWNQRIGEGHAIASVYIIGSLRNPLICELGTELRTMGLDVFDDWYGSGPEADDYWMKYEKQRGRHYKDALNGYAAKTIFNLDKTHLNRCDAAVMVMPAGKSAHLELGYVRGLGKPGFILFDKEPERYEVMYQFATDIFFDKSELLKAIKETKCNR